MHMSLNGNAIIPDEELQGSVEPIREVRGKLTGLEFIQGHSAYEVAVINGFIGTEEEWLASLKGEPGKQGPPGTVVFEELTDEQKELLKGKPGKDGEDGVSPAVSVEEIEGGKRISITDANGTKVFDIMDGEDGNDGSSGKDGVDGNGIKSVILNADYTLTLTLDDNTTYTTPSIRGEKGHDGADGRGILSIERDGGEWKVTYEDGEVVKLDAPDVQGAVSYAEAQELTDEQKAQARDNIGAGVPVTLPTIPSALPNPYKLKLTGAVAATYDGSKEVTVEIPKAPELPENIVQSVNGNAPDENGNVTIEVPEGGTGDIPVVEELPEATDDAPDVVYLKNDETDENPGADSNTGDYIPIPETAEVGEVMKVSAVDDTSKPTAWEPVSVYSTEEIDAALGAYITDIDALVGGEA